MKWATGFSLQVELCLATTPACPARFLGGRCSRCWTSDLDGGGRDGTFRTTELSAEMCRAGPVRAAVAAVGSGVLRPRRGEGAAALGPGGGLRAATLRKRAVVRSGARTCRAGSYRAHRRAG